MKSFVTQIAALVDIIGYAHAGTTETELHQQKHHKIIIQISPPRCLSVASLHMCKRGAISR